MSFRLIERNWKFELAQAFATEPEEVCLICPFIKLAIVEDFLSAARLRSMRVITRFSLQDFAAGVSDVSALQALVRRGVGVRGVRNLHSKLYIFPRDRVFITSANLTYSGLTSNHEYGCASDEQDVLESCIAHFESKWGRAATVSPRQLDGWAKTVSEAQLGLRTSSRTEPLPDYGALLDETPTSELIGFEATPIRVLEATRAFVKFSGTSSQRASRNMPIVEAVLHSATDRVLSYPRGKRPRQVKDGDIMFIGRLVSEPDDLMIYGRAIGTKHDVSRDVATAAELVERPWRAKWPNYIRVHDAEFINADLVNGISLNALMTDLNHFSFASTLRNFNASNGNVEPRKAYSQQPSVELSPGGTKWLNLKLERAFAYYGKISNAALER